MVYAANVANVLLLWAPASCPGQLGAFKATRWIDVHHLMIELGFHGINSASEEADISLGSGWRPKMEPKVANTLAISLRGYNVNTGSNLAVAVVHSNTLMFNNTPRCFERKKTCKPPPVSLKGLSC